MTAKIVHLSPHGAVDASSRTGAETEAAVREVTPRDELRRARIRILQLESSLTAALRDSAHHHDRARTAERRLEELQSSLAKDRGAAPALP